MMRPDAEARDSDIRAAIAAKETQDVKIAQKIMATHREAFRLKWPSQLEHCLRLTAERLQSCLNKPEGCVLQDPKTWPADDEAIRNLAMAVESLYAVYREVHVHETQSISTPQN
jgi:hypothetical protein